MAIMTEPGVAQGGLYSYQRLRECVEKRIITSSGAPVEEDQIQPASIDLRLGPRVYRLLSSFLPENQGVLERIHTGGEYGSDLVMYEMDISDGGILERGHVYLVPLMEELNLPERVRARANPKSTTGRLDVFARVLSDRNPRFDDVPAGYRGKLFLEILPRSFTIRVKEGLSLVQMRLMDGECTIPDSELVQLHEREGILYDGEGHIETIDMSIAKGLFMGVDLHGGGDAVIGYRSKNNSHVIDLTKRNYYNIKDFWEPILRDGTETLILEPEVFYILSSKERIRIPPEYAAEMVAYEAGSGELRTHYAGFFDPGFGYGLKGEVKGTKAVLEVRAHDVPFLIAHGQTFCKLTFERMMERPEKVYGPRIGSSYQFQGITLSKQFRNP